MLFLNLQLGLDTERIILSAPQMVHGSTLNLNQDPKIRFPIPNEREMRQQKRRANSAHSHQARKIAFNGDGAEVRQPKNLPFKPPGLQWQGSPSLTTRQLEEQREKRIGQL